MLPLFAFFILGLPLIGAFVAGLLKNSSTANCISIVSLIPSLLFHVFSLIVFICEDGGFVEHLTAFGILFFLVLFVHVMIRFLVCFIRTCLCRQR